MEEELDLKEIFKMLWNGRGFIILITVLFVALALVYSYFLQTPKYQSSTTLVLIKADSKDDDTTSVTTTDVTLNQKLVSTYSEIAKSKSVLGKVISNLNIASLTEGALRSNVKVTSVKDTEVIQITVTNENANNAALIANEIGKVFSEKITDMYKINNVYTLDEAEVQGQPYNIKPVKYAIIAFVLGMVVSCGILFIRYFFDTTVKSADEIEKALKTTVIAQIPCYDEIIIKKGGKK